MYKFFLASWNLIDHNFHIKIPSIGERTVFGILPRTSDSNLITRPLISWSSLVKYSLVNTDFRINIKYLSTCMLIIKLSCTVNSKYISDSKYEMFSNSLLYEFLPSAATVGQSSCHQARLDGNMYIIIYIRKCMIINFPTFQSKVIYKWK